MADLRYDPKRGEHIPLARQELVGITDRLRKMGMTEADEIAAHIGAIVKELMYRNPQRKRAAAPRQAELTPHLVTRVKAYLKEHPDLHDRVIGRMFNIDGGRVSEISQGHRTVEHPEGTPEWRGRT